MGRKKLDNPKDPTDPNFWRQWFRTERQDGNEVMFGWLKDALSPEEYAAVKEATRIEGYEVIETKKGGVVICKTNR